MPGSCRDRLSQHTFPPLLLLSPRRRRLLNLAGCGDVHKAIALSHPTATFSTHTVPLHGPVRVHNIPHYVLRMIIYHQSKTQGAPPRPRLPLPASRIGDSRSSDPVPLASFDTRCALRREEAFVVASHVAIGMFPGPRKFSRPSAPRRMGGFSWSHDSRPSSWPLSFPVSLSDPARARPVCACTSKT